MSQIRKQSVGRASVLALAFVFFIGMAVSCSSPLFDSVNPSPSPSASPTSSPAASPAASPAPSSIPAEVMAKADLIPVPVVSFFHYSHAYTSSASYVSRKFTHGISGFLIGQYEVTYGLWYAVCQWASANQYTIVHAGRQGSAGTEGAEPTASGFDQPVTSVTWLDAVVWCNAFSELTGLTPVYRWQGNVLKDSGANVDEAAVMAGVTCDWTADGLRLPTEGEWQAAARYVDGTQWIDDDMASGSTGVAATYAVFGAAAAASGGTKSANPLGAFDMSGNVWEYGWDFAADLPETAHADYRGPASGTARVRLGGSYANDAADMQTALRFDDGPGFRHETVGFRVACKGTGTAAPPSPPSGTVDTSFNGGSTKTYGASGDDYTNALAIDSSGRILVAGSYNNKFALMRFNSDGSIDTTWATNGIFTALSDYSSATYVHQDSLGNYVVVGGTFFYNGGVRQKVAVYVLDSTNASVIFSDATTVLAREAWALEAVQLPNNDIYVASTHPNDHGVRLSKWKLDGTYKLDTAWGTNGIVDDMVTNLRPDRIIYDATNSNLIISSSYQFIRWYALDGTLQKNQTGPANPVTVLETGAVSCLGTKNDYKTIQVCNFGRVDPWTASTPIDQTGWASDSTETRVWDAVKDNQGNTLIVGTLKTATTGFDGFIGKLKSDSSPDTAFDTDGIINVTDVFAANKADALNSIVIDAEGRIVVAGHALNSAGNYDIILKRIYP